MFLCCYSWHLCLRPPRLLQKPQDLPPTPVTSTARLVAHTVKAKCRAESFTIRASHQSIGLWLPRRGILGTSNLPHNLSLLREDNRWSCQPSESERYFGISIRHKIRRDPAVRASKPCRKTTCKASQSQKFQPPLQKEGARKAPSAFLSGVGDSCGWLRGALSASWSRAAGRNVFCVSRHPFLSCHSRGLNCLPCFIHAFAIGIDMAASANRA